MKTGKNHSPQRTQRKDRKKEKKSLTLISLKEAMIRSDLRNLILSVKS